MHDTTIEALRQRYIRSLDAKADEIAGLATRLDRGEPSGEQLRTLGRAAHRIAGSAAFYGFTDIVDAARAVEALVNDGAQDGPQRAAWLERVRPAALDLATLLRTRARSRGGS